MANNAFVLDSDEINSILKDAFQDENLEESVKDISSGYTIGDGYSSFWTMVKVKGKDKQINLAIKCAPRKQEFRDLMPIREAFLREIYFYDRVFPILSNFQNSRRIVFNSVAKCYNTSSEMCKELVVLDNLKLAGFKLWDGRKPMNDDHIFLVLKAYANFHALSFALKDQERDVFLGLVSELEEILTPETLMVFNNFMEYGFDRILTLLHKEEGLCKAVRKMKDGRFDTCKMFMNYKREEGVILHGDSWCNNMMFKYEDANNPNKPTSVNLIDFQLVRSASPVFDLSVFIYFSSGKNVLDNISDYLKYYHDQLYSSIQALGSNPCDMYPMENFMREWKLYSRHGLIMSCLGIHLIMREKDETCGIGSMDQDVINRLAQGNISKEKAADDRLCDLARHMYEHGFI